ncbi:MAG: hypothetical protein JXR96_00255 [Deltaproteobacteria bacterium]|nr:hypothetical protein [Deltaproteobacteria bacterium]
MKTRLRSHVWLPGCCACLSIVLAASSCEQAASSGSDAGLDAHDGQSAPDIDDRCAGLDKLGEVVLGEIMDFALDGETLVAVDYHGLAIYSLSSPDEPALLGRLPTPGEAWRVDVQAGHAFVADGRGGLLIADISRPEAPFELARLGIGGEALDVAVRDRLAVVASLQIDPVVLDIAEPYAPAELSRIPHPASELAFSGGRLVLYGPGSSENLRAVRVIDLGVPASPVELGCTEVNRDFLGSQVHETPLVLAWGMSATERYAFLADMRYNEIQVIDLGDPAAPFELGWFHSTGEHRHGLDSVQDTLLAAVDDALVSFDVSRLGEPNEVGRLVPEPEVLGRARIPAFCYLTALDAAGSLLLTASRDYAHQTAPMALQTFDLDAAPPAPLARLELDQRYLGDAVLTGSHALVARWGYGEPWEGGVLVVDLADPARPELEGAFGTLHPVAALAVDGARAVLAGSQELVVAEISDPSQPAILGSATYPDLDAEAAALCGEHACVVSGALSHRLRIFDLRDPEAIAELGSLALSGTSPKGAGIAVDGQTAYVANGTGGLRVIDVSDPARPVELGACTSFADFATDVALSPPHAIVAAGVGVYLVDIRDPSHPQAEAFCDTPGYASQIRVRDGRILVDDTYSLGVYALPDGH